MITRIFYNEKYHNIHPEDKIKTFAMLRGFCVENELPPNTLIRSRGGYYHLEKDSTLRFFSRNLNDISYQDVYDLLIQDK